MSKKIILSLLILTSACAQKIYDRGIILPSAKIASIKPGTSTESVRKTLGSPSFTSMFSTEETWFYLSYQKEQTTFFTPEQVNTKLYSYTFDKNKKLILQKDLELTPKNLKIAEETTAIPGSREESWFKSLFSNIGRYNLPSTDY
jgi:outer membrane protein assembly factor BamE (lipoprotein component of BamABCDE complex)